MGVSAKDTADDVKTLSKKILSLGLFEDFSTPPAEGVQKWVGKPWAKSLLSESNLSVLSISQFTLYGTIKKGTKPDFHRAAKGQEAKHLYDMFLQELRKGLGDEGRVKDGVFGAMMDVSLVNEGPVTIVWDTDDLSM